MTWCCIQKLCVHQHRLLVPAPQLHHGPHEGPSMSRRMAWCCIHSMTWCCIQKSYLHAAGLGDAYKSCIPLAAKDDTCHAPVKVAEPGGVSKAGGFPQ
jgi:hypothetical protein